MTGKKQNLHLPDLPFPGIDPFNYAERNVFFAREQESRALIRLVVIHRGVLLYSDSGTGKSSLINAGLLPHAVAEGFQPEKIRVQPRQDEEIIVERLSESAHAGPPFLPSIFSADDDEERVVLPVASFLETIKKKAQSTRPLLIFDQFEEWFTLFEEGAKRKQAGDAQATQVNIRDAILSLLGDTELPVKILLVLREDYLAKLTPFFKRYANLPDQYLRLTHLKSTEIKRIIRGPFEDHPGHYEPEIPSALAQKIRQEFEDRSGGEPVRLSEVQIVCRTLYESGKAGGELEAYFDQHSGVQGILEEYLRQSLESLPKNQRDPAVGLLSRMITAAGTRNVISGEDVISRVENEDNIPRNILRKTLDSLEQETKLVRRERRREVYYYEIASEFLVAWIRVKAKERAERLRIKETERALREQAQQARVAATLRQRKMLLWISFVIILVTVTAALISVSQRNRADEQRQEADEQRQEADEQRQEAEKQKVIAEAQRTEAEEQRKEAEEQKKEAEEQRQDAVSQRQEAEKQKAIVDRFLQLAKARDKIRNLALIAPLRHTTGALLAQQAYLFNKDNPEKFPGEIYNALRKTLIILDPNAGGPTIRTHHEDWARAVASSNKGYLASGGADGKIRIWNFKSDPDEFYELMKTNIAGHAGSIRSLAFSPAGDKLASCGDDGIVRLWWNLGQQQKIRTAKIPQPGIQSNGHQNSLWTVAFSPDGRFLASGGADGKVHLWNPQGFQLDTTLQHGDRVRSVAFNSKGDILASAGEDGKITIWQLQKTTRQFTRNDSLVQEDQESPVRAIAFHPNSDTLLAGREDGSLSLWDLKNKHTEKLFAHDDRVNSVAFSAKGDMFASASADGSVTLWRWDEISFGPVVLRNKIDKNSWVWSLAFGPKGDRLITGSSDKTIRSWITSLDTLSKRICDRVQRNLTCDEWNEFVGEEFEYEDTCPGKGTTEPCKEEILTSK